MASTTRSSSRTGTAAKSQAGTRKSATAKAAPAAKGKTSPAKKTAAPAKNPASRPTKAATEFKVYAPEAKEVLLAGDFCDWQGEDCRMRRDQDGSWKKSLKLSPGRYEYRFVVDGHWWTDPENPLRQQNPFGQDNSVLVIP